MSDAQEVLFSKAEVKQLRELAFAANTAQDAYWKFVGFLYEQHDVSQTDGWIIGQRGFEKAQGAVEPGEPDGIVATPEPEQRKIIAQNGNLEDEMTTLLAETTTA